MNIMSVNMGLGLNPSSAASKALFLSPFQMRTDMDARELRYGNFALCERCDGTKVETQAFELKANGTWLSRIGLPITDPIPLTEEWLTRFGFEKDSEFWYSIHFACYTEMGGDRIYELSINPEIGKCIVEFVGYYGAPIEDGEGSGFAMSDYLVQYVHQLQNLYFALTGEELELKDAKNNHR